MDSIQHSILRSIRQGSYFEDAKQWYIQRTLLPYTERTYLAGMLIIVSLSMLLILTNINRLFPTSKDMQVVVPTHDIVHSYSNIQPLTGDVSIQRAVAMYLVKRYVMFREYYQYDALGTQLQQIQHMSSKQEMKRFYDSLLLQNPTSPVFIMQKHSMRTIDVLSVALQNNSYVPDEAVVTYRATVRHFRTAKEETSEQQVRVVFSMPDLESLPETATVLPFTVVEYHPISQKALAS